jgi:hypothetical protein
VRARAVNDRERDKMLASSSPVAPPSLVFHHGHHAQKVEAKRRADMQCTLDMAPWTGASSLLCSEGFVARMQPATLSKASHSR